MKLGQENITLSKRRHDLLLATVQEFIATAEPVGSAQIVARHQLGVRAAMVRNIMSELEDAGFLRQPHTSAGRVPTEKAYRYYVDNLAAAARIGFEDRAQIELHYSTAAGDLSAVLRDTPRLLALLTGQAAMVMPPRLEASILEQVNFVRLREKQVLAVFVTEKGAAQNRIVDTERDHSQGELDRMARYLNDSLEGRTLDEACKWIAAQLKEERARYDRFMHDALALGEAISGHVARIDLYVEGGLQALEQPEFADRSKMRELLRALEDKSALLELLERSLAHDGLTVSIGAENYDPRLASLSVVAASYLSGSTVLGSLAIVGPVRMEYDRVIPLVEYTARAISRLLEH
ncbi:MAG: heat-inducible transcriptional repressor HrcA [Candidatus Binatus sp.]|uniref:heat-inducible transcriptional repressor HrcA n=1 Tax=Candidatus Binatus sp. TaxID=2811406 RepID=UPI002729204B|nr:heat-inducible transcriptional repressor HrcA [Candidatus Binatus sp.]MDO8431549.1 heat-inducible transcriptional repressor HrcA [Candidatus Binatus sp.]